MSPDFWAPLAEPFSRSSSTWRVVELADDLQTARLARTLTRASIAARLDEVVGLANWSYQLLPLGQRALVCNLVIAGVSRSGTAAVARGSRRFDVALLAEHALASAAEGFGMSPAGKAIAWVDFDAETGEPLYQPEDDEVEPGEADDLVSPRSGDVSGEPTVPAVAQAAAEAGAGAKPTGHDVIDRLLDRLREQGMGKEAARLVVQHGGYGRSQAEARELYGKLRALLLTVTTGTRT